MHTIELYFVRRVEEHETLKKLNSTVLKFHMVMVGRRRRKGAR